MKFIKDTTERVVWTAIQAGVGVVAASAADWPKEWAFVIAAGIALVKGLVARHIGDPDSASTVPSV